MKEIELVIELRNALAHARQIIHAWHGEPGWETYLKCAPEMRMVNEAIDKASKYLTAVQDNPSQK